RLLLLLLALLPYPLLFSLPDPATTAIYTLSLHDALPIFQGGGASSSKVNAYCCQHSSRSTLAWCAPLQLCSQRPPCSTGTTSSSDRKSTRLNSSHVKISYAVFCLKKKKKNKRKMKEQNKT